MTPVHAPVRTAVLKARTCAARRATSGITSRPSTTSGAIRPAAQRDVQHGALFGDVDGLAGEHPVAQRLDAA